MAKVDWMRKHPKWGVLDDKSEEKGFGQCLWNVEARGMQCTAVPKSGAKTCIEVLENVVKKFKAKNAVGWRTFVKAHQEPDDKGISREKLEYENSYNWQTYGQYSEQVLNMAKGFADLQALQAEQPPKLRIVIYAETQKDWMATAFAGWYLNAEIVTIYATLGEEGAIFGINQTKATIIVADGKLMKTLLKVLPECPTVTAVVSLAPLADDVRKKIDEKITVKSLEELMKAKADDAWKSSLKLPVSEDVAVIMYTSGTTGSPKGVRISHGNICATVAGVEHICSGLVSEEDTYLCYLPLAHIMEMVAEICFMAFGAALGFGSPHTLTDTGVKLKRPESSGDAPTLQPTFMVFAPAVLDKIYQGLNARVKGMTGFQQTMFQWGLNSGARHFDSGGVGANWLLNKVVFQKVQGLIGGRLKAMITGSAPLSPDIQKYIQSVFKAPVRQGYGLTETCAGSCVGFWGDNSIGCVGPPCVNAVIRLADWPEGNYMNSDKDKAEIGMRRGEVLIGGPSVSLGYLIDPENPDQELQKKNEEDWVTIQAMRFFRTGDIGQIKADGSLQIIDRKKDLWKGPNGEYVALTKVEAALKLAPICEMPMCYGKTGGEFPIALICPFKARLAEKAAEMKIEGSHEELCANADIVKAVSEELIKQCKAQKLVEFEIPKKFALIAELWTPENDLLTAAMKLKRPLIAEKHKAEIALLYTK